MGYGDELMATGMARGARERGRRIAFGDGRKIIWGPMCREIFRGNPNIAPPGSEAAPDIEWVEHYKGKRAYNSYNGINRWVWNYNFRPIPGEIIFDDEEKRFGSLIPSGAVLIEPNLPRQKSVAVNKDWGMLKYREVAAALQKEGHLVVQLWYPGAQARVPADIYLNTPSFRHALAALERASLYIGPEGGMHHGAAAVGIPAVVLFGGFIPPAVTGYDTHTNLTGGVTACGRIYQCPHCADAMRRIQPEEVLTAARAYLTREKAA